MDTPTIHFNYQPGSLPIPVELKIPPFTIQAYSRGAQYSFAIINEQKVAFDLGFCPLQAIRCGHIFITHAHEDHSWGVIRHIQYRKLYDLKPAIYYFPIDLVEPFREVLHSWNRFNRRNVPNQPVLVGLRPGDSAKVNNHYRVEAFLTHHRGPSLGYSLVKDQAEIPSLSYLGDHTRVSLDQHPVLGHSRILAIELTFIGDEGDKAHKYAHMHIDDLVDLAKQGYFKNEHVILKHLSVRYSQKEVERISRQTLGGLALPQLTII